MNILDQLRRDEGLRLTPYKDTVGKLTIGYGRNLDDVGINRAEADYLLLNDVAAVSEALKKLLPWTNCLDDARRAVLINMAFNMGIVGLLNFKNTLVHVQAGEYEKAAAHMLASKWATQVGARAVRLAQQMRSGEWK